jgi:sugar-specific transcriptional regulator TrmB
MEKRKAGRPKKVVTTAPEKTVKNAAYYKNIAENLMRANDELSIAIQQALEEKEEWFEHADKAHKEQEALVAVVKDLVDDTINNLINVEANIGSITVLDVIYNIGIIERVVEAKFNPKTEE